MNKRLLYVYKCPSCNQVHFVYEGDTYLSYLAQNVCHVCPTCDRKNVLWFDGSYWADRVGRLNPDIKIVYGDEYIKQVKEKEQKETMLKEQSSAPGMAAPSSQYGKIEFPKAIGYLVHEATMSQISVYHKINWFRRLCIRVCFGLKYKPL